MRRLKRSFWAKTAVAVASIAIAIGVIGGISFASNNQPFLGDCIEYGIVCNYLNQTADMETNFAVGKYQGNGHWNGNTISREQSKCFRRNSDWGSCGRVEIPWDALCSCKGKCER